jgi:gliding motility-associated-like protein
VTVTDDNGCTGTACIAVTVNDLFCDDRDIFIPNAFTPNTSGVNDVLFVRSNFIATMELVIYNRWGEKVFSTTDQSIGWDGTYNGQLLSPDVFGYYLTVTCPNEETYTKKGNITLLH